jgi:hypothetical protein
MTHQGAEIHLSSLEDALSRGFQELHYKKLKAVRVEIEAPAVADLGQMVCLWKKFMHLINLLSQVGRLPTLKVYLQDPNCVKWSTEGKPQKYIRILLRIQYCIRAILLPSCRLHNVPKASVHLTDTSTTVSQSLRIML